MATASEEFSEKDLIARALRDVDGDVRKAATKLDISEMWVKKKIAEHGLEGLLRT
jgi:transcriptional regulator with PAS, ATPase and Fis domain